MRKLLIANWKLNPEREEAALNLARAYDLPGVVVAPPFVFIAGLSRVLKRAVLGAQNVFFEKKGAYTGEISPPELFDLGVRYVILGHSERRALGETDSLINKKIKASLRIGLKAVLCVGEPLTVRKRGAKAAQNFVKGQLQNDLRGIKNLKFKIKNLIIAYEPIWAIGTGRADRPEEAAAMADSIKEFLNLKFKNQNSKVLYGGSVNAKNAESFLSVKVIDGALVGGASLRAAEFKKIVKICGRY